MQQSFQEEYKLIHAINQSSRYNKAYCFDCFQSPVYGKFKKDEARIFESMNGASQTVSPTTLSPWTFAPATLARHRHLLPSEIYSPEIINKTFSELQKQYINLLY